MTYATIDGGFTSLIKPLPTGLSNGCLVSISSTGGNTLGASGGATPTWLRFTSPYQNLTADIQTVQFAACDANSLAVGVVSNAQSNWTEFALGGHVRALYGGGSTQLSVNDLISCDSSGRVVPWTGASPIIGRALENINGTGNRVWISLLDVAGMTPLPTGQSSLTVTTASNHFNFPNTTQTMTWGTSGIFNALSSSVTGNDNHGSAILVPGTPSGAGTLSANFGTSYSTAPKVILTPTSAPAAVSGWYATSTTTYFTITYAGSSSLSGNASFNYLILP